MADLRPLAVFDMDGVLVEERSSWKLVHRHFGTDNEGSFAAYARGEIDDHEFMRRDISLWRSKDWNVHIDQVRDALEGANVIRGLAEASRELKAAGFALAIVSGGLDILAERLSALGGFDEVRANGLDTDDRGFLTGEGKLVVPLRDKGKVVRTELLGTGAYGPVVSVGDSMVDISMFRATDLSIAFRPETDEVAKEADAVIYGSDLRDVSALILEHFQGARNAGPL